MFFTFNTTSETFRMRPLPIPSVFIYDQACESCTTIQISGGQHWTTDWPLIPMLMMLVEIHFSVLTWTSLCFIESVLTWKRLTKSVRICSKTLRISPCCAGRDVQPSWRTCKLNNSFVLASPRLPEQLYVPLCALLSLLSSLCEVAIVLNVFILSTGWTTNCPSGIINLILNLQVTHLSTMCRCLDKSMWDEEQTWEEEVTHQTLVTVSTGHISFTGAIATDLIAWGSHHYYPPRVTVTGWWRTHTHTVKTHSIQITCIQTQKMRSERTLTPQWVVLAQSIVTRFAVVAA